MVLGAESHDAGPEERPSMEVEGSAHLLAERSLQGTFALFERHLDGSMVADGEEQAIVAEGAAERLVTVDEGLHGVPEGSQVEGPLEVDRYRLVERAICPGTQLRG